MWPFENAAKSNGFQFYLKKIGSVKVTQLEKANSIMSDLYINWDLPNKKVSHILIYGCDILSADELSFTGEFLSVDSKVLTGSTFQSAGSIPGPVSLSTTAKTLTLLPGKLEAPRFLLKFYMQQSCGKLIRFLFWVIY